MIEQQGRIESVEADMAWVCVGGRSGCEACDRGQGCGAGVFARLLDSRDARVRVVNSLGARPGDPVLLGLPERAYLALVLQLYGLPLLAGLLAGTLVFVVAATNYEIGGGALDAMVGIAALGTGGGMLLWGRARLASRFTRFSPRMLESAPGLDCEATGRIP